MKVIIAGSRSCTDYNFVEGAIHESGFSITEVVCGGAIGVDSVGRKWARYYRIPVKMFLPDWRTHGKKAGIIRNIEMADYAEALIAVWDGESRGTKHMIDAAGKKGIPVYIRKFRISANP